MFDKVTRLKSKTQTVFTLITPPTPISNPPWLFFMSTNKGHLSVSYNKNNFIIKELYMI